VTAAGTLRVAAVLDATGAAGGRHARALGGFLRDGLALAEGAAPEAVTHLFCAPDDGAGHLAAPTADVRLVHVPPHRTDIIAAALAAFQAGGGADLFVFPGGSAGRELAARVAGRTGGSALTDVLSATVSDAGLTCRRAVYAGHLTGEFELGQRPWCISLDAGWADVTPMEPAREHAVQAEAGLTEDDVSMPAPLLEVERLEPPRTGDLETARFLVVAGRGAGSRGGVERIAAAATRLGAAFGVTRPVVMNAWAGPDRQIGVSGTRTAPGVCIVAGASGAPAFLWGVERAGFIAAVDTDDHAPIAGESDAFVTGDAVAVLEALADLVPPRD
jgi:electron transfer flavoprotein alpha subunit